MSGKWKTKDVDSRKIEQLLGQTFSDVQVYRYNPASIRVRIIADEFSGLSRSDREERVLPLLEALPGDIQSDITVLLLLTPQEIGNSPMNVEFEHPSPSVL